MVTSPPVSPSPYQGEGEGLVLKWLHPFNLPHLTKGGEILKRGADVPLKHPGETNPEQRVPEGGLTPLLYTPARLTQSKES